MKRNVLRRAAALLLALALTIPAAVLPAGAADGQVRMSVTPNSLNMAVGEKRAAEIHVNLSQLNLDNYDMAHYSVRLESSGPSQADVQWRAYFTDDAQHPGTTEGVCTMGTVELTALRAGTYKIELKLYKSGTGELLATCSLDVQVGDTIPVEGVTLDKDTLSVEEGKTAALTPTVAPSNAANKSLMWRSSDESVATVGISGLVTGISAGTAVITVTTVDGGFKDTCTVTVTKAAGSTVAATGVTLDKKTLSVMEGATAALAATVAPDNATDKAVTWQTSDPAVATVANGEVTAVKAGTATITVTTVDGGFKDTCTVTVTPPVAVTGVTLDKSTLSVAEGDTAALTATVAPDNATNKAVTWQTSDPAVATVANGEVTGVKAGTATITVTTADGGKTAACTVTVVAPVAVTGVTLDKETLSVMEGDTAALIATVLPDNATNKAVTWQTSKPETATVDQNGKVTGVKAGTATITVTTADGHETASCEVTVIKAVPVTEIYINLSSIQFDRTGPTTQQVFANIAPSDATFGKVTWSSTNPAVASVTPDPAPENADNSLATVTAGVPGEADIIAEAGGKQSKICKVTVSGFTLSRGVMTLLEGKSESLSIVGPYGQAKDGSTTWQSSDPAVVTVAGGKLTGRSVGSATITASRGAYTATCVVTVVEDTSCLIQVGKRFTAGEELKFDDKVLGGSNANYTQSIRDALDSISRTQTGAGLSYVSNLSVSTEQGTVYYNYLSEGDTGSGVGMTERFYYSPGVGQQSITKLSFISRNDYSGVAEISYTGYATNRQSFKGVIRIQVGAMYDAFYSTYSGVHVTFRASDFNAACQGLTGRDLSYVTFTLPQESRGMLYYNYPGPTQYTEKVTAGTQYRYTSTPSLNNVSFAPAEGYTGTFSITYRGVNTAGVSFTGRLVVTVNDPVVSTAANLYYSAEAGKQFVLRPSDFDNACRAVTGETLSHVRFTPPPSSHGSLIYDYRSVGSPGTPVAAGTSYYRSGSPALGSVSFFSVDDPPGQVAIDYLGYGSGGSAFRGTVYITLDEVSQQTIRYSVDSGQAVIFLGGDFNIACRSATGETLNYVRFQIPVSGEGLLCYQYNASRKPPYTSRVSSLTSYYYTGGTRQISNVAFLSNADHAGTVSFNYTGYTKSGATFTGTVVVQVNPATSGQASFSGTTVEPIRLYSYTFRSACNPVLDKELAYIQFDSLPSNSAGRLYINHSGYGTGTPVGAGTKYYMTGTPAIDQISFVARGGYQGTVTIPYTGVSVSGRQVSGKLRITVNSVAGSRYFEDMGGHKWAAASADYLYLNGVTKGMSAEQYGPGLNIRRCDFVVMLCRIFKLTAAITDIDGFPDVPADAYYAKEVAIAKKLGIVSGDGVNFNPKGSLTRQDAMVIIRNTLNVMGLNTGGTPVDLDSFTDSAAISGYARSAVGSLVQFGVIKGDTNNRLRPRDIITRAEVAMILHSVMTM